MKKFGRDYVLDFAALMDEFRPPAGGQTSPDDQVTMRNTTRCNSTPNSTDAGGFSGGSSPTQDSETSYSSSFEGTQTCTTPDASLSPTEEAFPGVNQRMKRMPARMSVSRTGRCKNRDRQRISVLEAADYYKGNHGNHDVTAAAPSAGKDAKVRTGGAGVMSSRSDVPAAESDGAPGIHGSSLSVAVVTDCYSF